MEPFQKTLYAYLISAFFGVVGGLITIGMILLLEVLTKLIWEQGFNNDTTDPARTPFVFLTFMVAALVAGYLAKKYTKPLVGMDEIVAQIIEKGKIRWQDTGRAIINGIISIVSGASLGPEAPSAFVSAGAASFVSEKTKQPNDTSKIINAASVSGMLGSLLSSPFLAPALIAETAKGGFRNIRSLLTYSMVASAFGVGTFFALFHKVEVINIGLPAYSGTGLLGLAEALCIGFVAALFIAFAVKFLEPLMAAITKPFMQKPYHMALVGGGIAAFLTFCVPITMFSGQYTIPALIEKSAELGFVALICVALVKLFSTLLLLRSGFFGGLIFPIIFVGAALGLAITQVFTVSLTLAVGASIAGLLTIAMRQPLSAALLTIGIVGSSVTTVVAVAVAGACLLLTLLPATSQNKD